MKEVLLVVGCYLIGSIPFSYIISQQLGSTDIRLRGSGNVGATNVLRTIGPGYAVLSALGDVMKGIIAAWLATLMGGGILLFLCPLVAVVGHCYPIYLKFKGGKGVATSAGALVFLTPYIILWLFLIFVSVLVIFRIVSLSSLTVALLLPIFTIFLYPQEPYVISLTILLAALVIYRHKENITRISNGTEPRIGEKA